MPEPSIAIAGSNSVGMAVALACAQAGLPVALCEPDAAARDRVQVFAAREDKIAAAGLDFTADYERLQNADIVFDALDRDEGSTASAAVLAAISDSAIVATPGPDHFWENLHYHTRLVRYVPFQPMHLRRLTEITGFSGTSDATTTAMRALTERIGRVPVLLDRGSRSIGLRLLDRLYATADDMLLQGAVLWELDAALTAAGFDMGPYEAQDLTGLDAAYARRRLLGVTSPIADRAVSEGRIGKKIGWGWYRYPGGGGAVIDPLIEDLIHEESHFAGIEPRRFSDDEIVQTILDALLNEIGDVIAAGELCNSEDVENIFLHGLGISKETVRTAARRRGIELKA